MGALDGIRVIDATAGVAGPLAGMLLADHGADVVKVEPPGGDPGRQLAGGAMWNRNKRSVVADGEALADLVGVADVCLVGGDPPAALSAPVACERNARLVHVSLPPFDAEGTPWGNGRESNGLLGAVTGVAFRQASAADVPVEPVYPHLLYGQAVWAAAVTAAALVERETSGRGRAVTVGGVHAVAAIAGGGLVVDPDLPAGHPVGGPGGPLAFYRPYRCADGQWLFLGAITPTFGMRAFDVLDLMDLFADERIEGEFGNLARPDNAAWVIDAVAAAFARRPRDEWLKLLLEADVPSGPVLDRDEWMDHPQVEAIGMRLEVEDPERGRVTMAGIPLVLEATPGAVRRPAPRPGEHNGLVAWDRRPTPPLGLPAAGADGTGPPLAGYRVLDLGTFIAGTYCASLLGELGADVVKVEPPDGDGLRFLLLSFAAYNLGKRGCVLDLRQDAGRRALLRVVAGVDVLVDNYRPGVLARLGLERDDLLDVNPDLVTVSITGFGDAGPLADRAGFDPILQAMSGMMAAQGGDSGPVFFTVPVNDVAAATLAAFGAGLALLHRHHSGDGQRVRLSLAASSVFMQGGELVRWAGAPAPPVGSLDWPGPTTLDRFWAAADGFVRVQAGVDDLPALAAAGLVDRDDATGASLGARLAALGRDDAVRRLLAAGVAAVVARRPRELPSAPEAAGAGLLQPPAGESRFWLPGRPTGAWPHPAAGGRRPPGLGEHTRQVLLDAGLDDGEIDALVASGAAREGGPFPL